MPTRHDLSSVPLQGGYVAKRCPVRAQNDMIRPCRPAEADAFQQRLFERGNAFEAEIVEELLAGPAATVVVDGDGDDAERGTLAAMRDGAPLILHGRLRDEAGRRVGEPDLLVRCSSGGYHPVDVKWHMALDVAQPGSEGQGVAVSPLSTLRREAAVVDRGVVVRRHEDDVLQLAHYRRLLEALGFAPGESQWAGIIGVERKVVWHDLDRPMWRTPSTTEGAKLRTTMERYDFEFDFRLDIIAVAQRHLVDPSVQLLVVPVRCSECPSCPWNPYCRSILEAPPGDVSLLPHVGWTQWKLHREFGVTNRAQLAGLDTRTAGLVAAKVDVAGLMQKVQQLEPGQPLGAVQGISLTKRELRHLSDAGIATCGDLQALDAATGRYTGVGMASLVEQIDLARAALGPEPVYRRRGVDRIVVPWADVEVDIDMESIEAGAYLWGTLVTRRAPGVDAAEATYVPFVTWDPLTAEVEAANSRAFWDWLMQLRQDAEAAGRTFAAFCWNAPAENQFLRRLGRMDGIADAVEAFIASDEWVDLLKVWDGQVVTGGPSGLKEVAPLGGVAWTVDDPGGAESMVRYDVAMGAAGDPERAAARRWLLEYNAGDVRATRAIREWLTHAGSTIPSVESLDPRVID